MQVDLARLIDAAADAVAAQAEQLTELDRAVGDGDFGLNFKRGFDAVRAAKPTIAADPLDRALQKIGAVLVTTVGGSSGAIFGTLFLAMGKAAAGGTADLAALLTSGADAVMARGKAKPGEKTMLDALIPVRDALQATSGRPRAEALAAVREAADRGVEATKTMPATRGRSSFLGDRAFGHPDPGAQGVAVLVHAICDALEEPRKL